MPNNRNEPAIYSGRVMMMMGSEMGNLVTTPYKVAQGLVSSGQARWEGDTSPMPRQVAQIIREREEAAARAIAEDAAIYAASQAGSEGKGGLTDRSGARPFTLIMRNGKIYLGSPFPAIVEIAPELFDEESSSGFVERKDDMIAFRAENASAIYRDQSLPGDAFIYAELVEATMPEVEIPENWRERNHFPNIADAKKIMGLDAKEKMTKAEAEEILERWTAKDDTVPTEDGSGDGGEGGASRNENGRNLDGNHEGPKTEGEDGKPIVGEDGKPAVVKTPEEIAKESERAFVEGDGF